MNRPPLSARIGGRITRLVGTMGCAILFAALAFVSLPAALHTHDPVIIIGWIAQTFLQLVLLPVIMVGQDLSARSTEAIIRETHDAVLGLLGTIHTTTAATHRVMTEPIPTERTPSYR